jgi:hypothetical protein
VLPGQYTLGILLYTQETTVTITYFKNLTQQINSVTVNLNKTYLDVPNNLDMFLGNGSSTPIDTSIINNKLITPIKSFVYSFV